MPLAQKGRSLAVVTATPAGDGWTFEVEQRLVTDGPRDPAVQGWVDEFYQRQRRAPATTASPAASETEAVPPVTACLPCHEEAVRGWRATAHARAVETLKQASREVAECLRCHDETFRRTGVIAPVGDQGIVCASCHGALAAHLHGDGPPTTAAADTCLTCHDREHSQQFEPASYLALITAAH
ncbi:MAG: hypothetical protein HUU35_10645 [Armatimonadetes bacterium]|nr:hypothetical protein [Armatimonadota bacterium]